MWILNITELVKKKNANIELIKVKSHSEDRWNDRADFLAKKGANCKEVIQTKKLRCEEIEYQLEWEKKRIDISARLLCKIIANARIGANWRDINSIRTLEPETEHTRHNWSSFWKEMNRTKGVHCTSKKLSTRRATAIKCIINSLPTLVELNKRRPEVYTTTKCQVCQNGEDETQEHLASCNEQKSM
jgi:viroplasmin and RNaseH domain-containing protein